MGGILFVAVIVLMFLAIFALIFQERVLTIVYASIGALIFCFYLVYDIQVRGFKIYDKITFKMKQVLQNSRNLFHQFVTKFHSSLQFILFLANDGRQAQILDITRGIHFCCSQLVHRHRQHFHLYPNDHWSCQKLRQKRFFNLFRLPNLKIKIRIFI